MNELRDKHNTKNIICIPYHDWRKIGREDSRAKNSHFSHLERRNEVEKLLVVNRSITYTEILAKKGLWQILGEIVYKYKEATLYKIS